MSARNVALLALAALLVIALAVLLATRRDAGQLGAAGEPVLPGLADSVNEVTEVRLTKGDGARVTLRRRETDWVVGERDYRADSGRIRKLLLDLGALEVVEEKTAVAAKYPELGVEDVAPPKGSGTLVEVIAPERSFTLILGKPAGTKGGYVRVPGNPQSVHARPQVNADADAKRWIDRTLLDIPQDRIREVSIEPTEGPEYTVTRPAKDVTDFSVTGVPKGRQLSSPSAANGAASALASLTLDDVRRVPEQPVDPRQERKAKFTTFDGLTLEVSGRKEGERHFLAARAESASEETRAEADALNARLAGWEFEIPAYKYDAIFRPIEELLAES